MTYDDIGFHNVVGLETIDGIPAGKFVRHFSASVRRGSALYPPGKAAVSNSGRNLRALSLVG
jgi:hypothetical protein